MLKKITTTGILLAVCIAAQCLKGLSVYITGPLVNAVIILATLSVGLFGGLSISIISPLIAALLGATPIINMIPLMILVIMAGNCILAIAAYLFRQRFLPVGLAIGSAGKALFLWLTVWYIMLPIFGTNISEKVQLTMKTTFSITQLITALIGSVIAYVIWSRLKNVLKFGH